MGMVYLLIATLGEVVGTTALKASNGFSQWRPTLIVIASYAFSFYLLALSLKTIPLGVGYALWAGIGTALTVIIGIVVWKEAVSLTNVLGILFIVCGVIMLNMKKVSLG